MIRYAVPEDIPRLAEMLVFGKRVAYRDIFRDDDFSFNHLRVVDVAQAFLDDPRRLARTMVYDDGIVKGMIGMQASDAHPEAVELIDFYVEPAFQGSGIGRQLIEHFIREARALNKKESFLWVIKDNLPARRFYERNGFRDSGEEKPIDGTPILDRKYIKNL